MKKILLSLAAIATLASCSNDDLGNDPNNPGNGEQTYVQFTLNSKETKAMTRADVDPEITIKEASFYIFSAGLLEAQIAVTAANKSGEIATTTGVKEVIILANTKSNWTELGVGKPFPTLVTGSKIADVRALLEDLKANNPYLTTPVTGALDYANTDVAEATAKGFIMTSSTVIDVQPGGTRVNPIVIHTPAFRAGSKLALAVDETALNASSVRKKIPGAISLSHFALTQTTKNIHLGRQQYQEGANSIDQATGNPLATLPALNTEKTYKGEISTPEGLVGYDHLYGYSDLKSNETPSTFAPNAWKKSEAKAATNSALGITNYQFIPENIIAGLAAGSKANRGEVTFSSVKMTYLPTKGEMKNSAALGDVGHSFFAIQHKESRELAYDKFFHSANEGNEHLTENPNNMHQVVEYVKGVMYYRVDLSNVQHNGTIHKYSIFRNSQYLVDVNSIIDYGMPNVFDLAIDPTDPIEKEAKIDVTIKVIDYNKIETTPDLG
jgi:hypothetical protein